ncbi:MAG TPA: response regulator [Bacteroidia bacterium]|jgi:DNA-binding NtrC family response regulator|nr:response regulator [Bacteroidia bacterium]
MEASEKIKIFIVDDDAMFTDSLKHSLSGKRRKIHSFSNGEECIGNLHEDPHIIVLDYVLNDSMNGLQVLNQIRHDKPETRVIMLSGIDNTNIVNDTLKYGACDFIEKDETALLRLKKEINEICDEIEAVSEIEKEDNKMLWINAGIIVLIILGFILTHVK